VTPAIDFVAKRERLVLDFISLYAWTIPGTRLQSCLASGKKNSQAWSCEDRPGKTEATPT